MRYPHGPSIGHRWRGLALAMALFGGACGQPPTPAAAPDTLGEIRHFTGTWSFTGNRQLMKLAAGDQAAIFSVSGSLLLAGRERPTLGVRAEIIGFSDSQTGMVGRSVWIDHRGDKAFSELSGESALPGHSIKGRFTGGTGRYAGVTGEYNFTWQRLAESEDGVSGRVGDLAGWARLAAPVAPAQGGPR
jgi:hypothetical protein